MLDPTTGAPAQRTAGRLNIHPPALLWRGWLAGLFAADRVRARLALGFMAALLLLTGLPVLADDFELLRSGWRNFMIGGTNIDLNDSIIAARVSSAASTANSQWSSLNKAAGRTYLWSDAATTTVSAHLTTCYSRLSAMAQGWAMTGSSLYGNPSLAADILSALDWMYTNRYNETKTAYNNWWDWEIGVPMALNNAMVLMYPALSGTQITNFCKAIDKFSPAVTMTGANRVWKAQAVGVRGAVGNNAAKVAAARDGLSDVAGAGASSVFAYVTSGDGFYRDGSFIQHGRHPYTAGYGLSLFRDVVKMIAWLEASPWAVTDPQQTNIVRWCYDSYEPMIYRGALPEHLRGREISRNSSGYGAGRSAINAMLRVAQRAPGPDAGRLNRMVKYWAQADTLAGTGLPGYVDIDLVPTARQLVADSAIPARAELVGHYQFPAMARVMHLRPGFGFGLSMFSSRIYNYECINSENWHAWFTSYGMTWLWNDDLAQFTDFFWPTVDPYHLPGTTVVLTPLSNGVNQSKTSSQSWVGGAGLSDGFGSAGLALQDVNSTLRANKSWFMFDNEIVCLGAGITCGSATNVHTTVENRRLTGSGNNALVIQGVTMSTAPGWSSNLNNVTWCALEGDAGFYFPAATAVSAARQTRSGAWSDINAGGSTSSAARTYLSLVLDHGAAATNATYAYVILPNCTAAATALYAANPETSVVTNTPAVQAVRETKLGLLGANFWSAAGGTADFITANAPAAVMTRIASNVLEVAVSDPTWTNTKPLLLTLKRAGTQVLSVDAGVSVTTLSPTVQLTVNVTGARGKTFQVRLAVKPGPSAAPDHLETSVSTPVTFDPLANDDSAGVPIALDWLGPTAHGTVAASGNRVTYVPAAGYQGPDSFSYSLTDGNTFSTGAVSVAVGPDGFNLAPFQVTASADDGNLPENTVDNDLNTRWSALGDPQWIQYDLLSTQKVDAISVAFFNGAGRTAFFDLAVSLDGATWTPVFAGQSGGAATNLQRFDIPDRWASQVRFIGHSNSQSGWNSITELRVHPGTNTAPLAQPDFFFGRRDQPVICEVLANDSDPDQGPAPLQLLSWSTTTNGVLSVLGAGLRYQPNPGFAGQDAFFYVIGDGGLQATSAVTVEITNAPVFPPVFVPVVSFQQMAGLRLWVTNQVQDPSAPPQQLIFSLQQAPTGATIDPRTGVISWRPPLSQAGLSNRFEVVAAQDGWQTNLPPVADAFVRDGSYAGSNYGAAAELAVKLAATGLTREAYLKFSLADVPGSLVSADLALLPVATSGAGTQAAATVPDDSWTEPGLVWNNKPASDLPLGSWTPRAGIPVRLPVTTAAQAALAAGRALSVRLYATTSTADGLVNYGSREGPASQAPALALTTRPPVTLTATQSFWVCVTSPPPPAFAAVALGANGLLLTVAGASGPDYLVQASTNLVHWADLFSTSSPALPFEFRDPAAALDPARFYRLALGPW